ncbi:MAG: DeoR family transcriptional regulator, partial [Streptosporangiaceae bacterium]
VTVVADHTKWGIVGLSSFAGLDEVDTFITDDLLHEEAVALLREQVGELVLADGQPDGQVG